MGWRLVYNGCFGWSDTQWLGAGKSSTGCGENSRGEKVKSRLSEVWLWSTIIRMHFRSAQMENAKLRWKSRRVWFSRKIRKSLAAASKSQAKPDVRNLKLDLHYITTNSETTTFTIVVKDNIISFSSRSTFKKDLEILDRPLVLVKSPGRQARVIPHHQPHFLQKIHIDE